VGAIPPLSPSSYEACSGAALAFSMKCLQFCRSAFFPFQLLIISSSTWLCLILWQFSQFFLATQTVAVAAMFIIGAIDKHTLLIVLFGQIVSISSFSVDNACKL
jgi:hypothetical protein